VTFYVVLPLWALAMRRVRIRNGAFGPLGPELLPLAIVAGAGVIVQLLTARRHISELVGTSLAGQCTWFCIGMALAALSVAAQREARLAGRLALLADRPGLCWAGSAAAFGGLMALVPAGGLFGLIAAVQSRQSASTTLAKVALEAAQVVLLVLPAVFGARRAGLPRRVLGCAPVVWLGVVSYSFYLYHFTIVQLIALPRAPGVFTASGLNLLGHVHVARGLVLYIASFAATAVVATLSYRLVELPFLRRKEA
jgi:peptidoglycan/LPS O-acetylase OafA/YrhL